MIDLTVTQEAAQAIASTGARVVDFYNGFGIIAFNDVLTDTVAFFAMASWDSNKVLELCRTMPEARKTVAQYWGQC